MHEPISHLPPPPLPPRRNGGFSFRVAFLSFALTTFVLGGLCFGWLFLANWRMLLEFRRADLRVPIGPSISVSGRPDVGGLPQPDAAAEIPQGSDLPTWSGTNRVNVLLLGIDHRDDQPIDGSRSDTIMVVSIDPPARSVVMMSLPRDLWVSIPGQYNDRINAAHVLGGPALVSRTVEANLGVRIHYYARIDFRGFEEIVDTLGGVIIDVERTIKDDEYPTEDYGIQRLFIPPGPQLMDGKLALQYARSRHSENDFGRARRQQRLLVAMRERGLQLNILPRVPSLVGLVQRTIQTDIGIPDLLALARLGSEIERDRIRSIVVDANLAEPFIGYNGEDLLMPRRADIQRAIARAFAEAIGHYARVEVLNGTERAGIARQLADQLAYAGYDVVRVDTADRTDYRETSLLVLNGNQAVARTLATQLRLPPTAIQIANVSSSVADIRIVLGQNYQPR